MTIYEFSTSMVAQSGSTSAVSLNIRGGLMGQLLVRANTSTTVFRVNIDDKNGITRMNYGFIKGELNDVGRLFPIVNKYTISVTNASANDTFRILLAVQED